MYVCVQYEMARAALGLRAGGLGACTMHSATVSRERCARPVQIQDRRTSQIQLQTYAHYRRKKASSTEYMLRGVGIKKPRRLGVGIHGCFNSEGEIANKKRDIRCVLCN